MSSAAEQVASVDPTTASLLTVRDLSIEVRTEHGFALVVDGVNLDVESGRTMALVGESGSGKTVTSLAIMGLVKRMGARVTKGSVNYQGQELLDLSENQFRMARGSSIGMIFQEPRRSLDPAFTVGDQIAEGIRAHRDVSRQNAWRQAVELLDLVGIPSASKRAKEYPYTFSGGMCQRVMLSVALAGNPKVLIADEPTTALDVTVQAQVLDLLKDLQEQMSLGILFITHDLSIVAEMSDRIAVMYAGQIVEEGEAQNVLRSPTHPYTAALMGAIPGINRGTRHLESIPGRVPSMGAFPSGCRFHPRCAHCVSACTEESVDLVTAKIGSLSRCIRVDQLDLVGV
jgi:peptide/nickel transport system ATP-binding protein